MPVEISYPGTYVNELEANAHSVLPTATNVAAFIGRAIFGPTNEPVSINSYADFQKQFGGLGFDFPLSYAVRDFFTNGGSEAVIARLFEPTIGDGCAQLEFSPQLILKAANPGLWGNRLTAKVDTTGITEATAAPFKDPYGIEASDLFNLTLTLHDEKGYTTASERYLNLTVGGEGRRHAYPNQLDKVLSSQSLLARVDALSEVPPGDAEIVKGTGGNDGAYLKASTYLGDQHNKTGMYLLEKAGQFNLLCIPPDRRMIDKVPQSEWDLDASVRNEAAMYAAEAGAFYIVDPISSWVDKENNGHLVQVEASDLGIKGWSSTNAPIERNCAVYFPRIIQEDPLMENASTLFAPCGAIAGVIASIDVSSGVWKAPAGQSAGIAGITKLELALTDADNGVLNPKGINCLRSFPGIGPVVWGARTLRGADAFQDEYKYISVKRLALHIEETLRRSTQWTVFVPHDETLLPALERQVSAWLGDLTAHGALFDYKVQCDERNNPPGAIVGGQVNITVSIAPTDPAEFMTIEITHAKPAG